MKIALKKRKKSVGLLCLLCSIGAAAAWMIIITLLGFNVYHFDVAPIFASMAVVMSFVITVRNFSNENFITRFVAQITLMIFSVAVMYGTFYLAIFAFFR